MSNAREQIRQLADRLKIAAQGECECTVARYVTTDHTGRVLCDECRLPIPEGATIATADGLESPEPLEAL